MPDRIAGHATPAGTRAYAARHADRGPGAFTDLGATELRVGRFGFGCYRIDDTTPDHRESLDLSLSSGCNLIDTSTNYTDGASERLVGSVLGARLGRGDLDRDAIVVVSKIGYVQGRNMRLAIERERGGTPFPDMVRYMDGCWHCIHPDFIADQLDRSLDRLGLATLDICLLHNPEYFLSDAKNRGGSGLEERRDEFYRRIEKAFTFLEDAVRRGAIRAYGVSSNSAVNPADDDEAISVVRMLEAARAAGGEGHHFRVLQIPMNLFEAGGALVRNTGPDDSRTPLEAASAAGLGVLLNRPFNAFVDGRLLRLAEPILPAKRASIEKAVDRLRGLERDYAATLAPRVRGSEAAAASDPLFRLAEQIAGAGEEVSSFVQWRQIEEQYVLPRVHYIAQVLEGGIEPAARGAWRTWWDRYAATLGDLLGAAAHRAAERGNAELESIAVTIDPALPEERRPEPLARKALWVLASTPGVSTVLVGMRRTPYVHGVLPVLGWPALPDPLEVYRRLRPAC